MKQYLSVLKEKIIRNKYPLISLVALLMLIGLSFSLFCFTNKSDSGVKKIGWVTDIHADRFKKRAVDSGKLYPKKYLIYVPKVFKELKKQKVRTVISTGDNTNSGDDNYAEELMRLTNEEKMDVIWVRGNHDNDEVMSILGLPNKQYYFRDIDNTRIIVLDSTEYKNGEYDYRGDISSEQIGWMKESLKTDKDVIIAMHIPIFSKDIIPNTMDESKGESFTVGDVLDRYTELEKIFRESKNIKLVLSGHWHAPWQKEHNGVKYYGESTLTRDTEEGSYSTINLETYEVEHKIAK